MIRKAIIVLFVMFTIQNYGQSDTISILTWNIRDFGQSKSDETLERIAKIVKDSDIIALQEVVSGYGGAQAVAKLSDILNRKGAKWAYAISDPTHSPKYCTERYAYLWKTKYIKIKRRGKLLTAIDTIVDREPFLIDFYWNSTPITMVNFHARPYSKNPIPEIKAVTHYMMQSLKSPSILLGDFNCNEKDTVFNDFKAHGYTPALTNQKTTLKQNCRHNTYVNSAMDNVFYTQGFRKVTATPIDFVGSCESLHTARQLSDHLPVKFVFRLD